MEKNDNKSDKKHYYEMITSSNKNFSMRHAMVKYALVHGNKPAARKFYTTVKTVRKWVRRYKANHNKGLNELSRRPRNSPKRTCAEVTAQIIRQRLRTPGFGGRRLKAEFDLSVNHNTITRIIRGAGLTRKRQRKHERKSDLRHIKQAYKPFTRFQMDAKHLKDIPRYWIQKEILNLPAFQYTIRELSTGAQFLAYSNELSKTYATLAVERFLEHMQRFGVNTKEIIFQTDLGAEFDGDTVNYLPESFHLTIEGPRFNAQHLFNPKSCPNANADVESVHSTIETEFYDAELFKDRKDFIQKVSTYQFWYNVRRKNCSRDWKAPLDDLAKKDPKIDPRIFLLHPIFLDHLPYTEGGYDVSRLPENIHTENIHAMNVSIQALKKEEWKELQKESTIYVGIYQSTIGNMLIAKTIDGIMWLSFLDEENLDSESIVKMISSKWQGSKIMYSKEGIEEEGMLAESLIKGKKMEKSLTLLPIGTLFQQKVWKALLDIPRGKTCTYSEVAEKIMQPTAVRATATAIANNPISLFIPCHRVVPSTGGVGKYAWGCERKHQLLKIESTL